MRHPKPLLEDAYRSYSIFSHDPMGVAYLAQADLRLRPKRNWHTHLAHQIIWVLSETMGMESEHGRFVCTAGTGCIVPAGVRHAVFEPADLTDRVATILDLRIAPPSEKQTTDLFRFANALDPRQVFIGDPSRWRALAAELVGITRSADTPRRWASVAAVLWSLLADAAVVLTPDEATGVTDQRNGRSTDRRADPRVRRAEEFWRDHLHDPTLDVTSAADVVGLSRSQLTRLFIDHLGIGPATRLRQLRVIRARELLMTSALSLKEIARAAGFNGPGQMTRVFRAVTGETPTHHRNAAII